MDLEFSIPTMKRKRREIKRKTTRKLKKKLKKKISKRRKLKRMKRILMNRDCM
jgi:hypothetical protein